MKNKIIKYSILLVVIAITIAAIFTYALAQYFYSSEVQSNIENVAILMSYQIKDQKINNIEIDYDTLAKTYCNLLNSKPTNTGIFTLNNRITIISYDGTVLGESNTNINEMNNHLNRKEIKEALQGKIGSDKRFSETLKSTYLYVAHPIKEYNIIIRISVPLYQINSINMAFLFYIILGTLAGLFLTILISVKVSVLITAPIHNLVTESKEIVNGDYKKRIDTSSKDEVGLLATNFNDMAIKLDETLCGILDKNVRVDSIINSMRDGIIAVDKNFRILIINTIACEIFGIKHGPGIIGQNLIDIARNSRIISYLMDTIKQNAAITDEVTIFTPRSSIDNVYKIFTNPIKPTEGSNLNSGGVITLHDVTSVKKLEQMRTAFVSNVTHELKTPLTSIRGFVETLKSGAINDNSVATKFLDIIDIEAERLYILINDILQLSEIEGMTKDTNISDNNLTEIIEEVVLLLQATADKKNIQLTIDTEPSILIRANKYRIKQMLINLIDNAIKYNVENGMIFIKAIRQNGRLTISIKDTGIGIPENDHSRIFERFYRVDKGRSRNMGGTGLGLSIVKHIVNLYNGDIQIKSVPQQGTEFIIRLPL